MRARRYLHVKVICRKTRRRRFVMRWRDCSGARHEQVIPKKRAKNRRQAERFGAEFERALNGLGDQIRDPLPLSDLATEFLAARETRGVRPRTLETYREILRHFKKVVGGDKEADSIGPRDIERYFASRRVGQTTRRRDWVHLKAVFAWGVKTERISTNPVAKFDAPRAPRPKVYALSEQDAVRFIEAASELRPWAYTAIRLALTSGMRIGELAALHAADIDRRHKTIRIPAQKSADDRVVGFDKETGGLLQELRHRKNILWGPPPPDGPFFSVFAFRRALCREARGVFDNLGLSQPAKPIHALRRTYASILARSGTPALTLMAVMGHKALSTTKEYYFGEDAERDAERARADLARAVPGLVRRAVGGTLGGKAVRKEGRREASDAPKPLQTKD